MREAYLIDELSKSLGQRVRKAVAPDFFQLIYDLFENLSIIGFEERLDATGMGQDSVYATDKDGNVQSLFLDSWSPELLPAIQPFKHLKLLVLTDIHVDFEGARVLASMRELEHLWVGLGEDSAEALKAIGKIQSLKGLCLEMRGGREIPIDLGTLSRLPHLESLILEANNISDLDSLLRFPSLRHLFCVLSDDVAHLAGLDRLETLAIHRKSGKNDKAFDFGFLRQMRGLQGLIAPDDALPLPVLRDLRHLRVLATKYPHSSLEHLFHLPYLEELHLIDSKLPDLSTLAGFKRLRILDLNNGETRDISHLRGQDTIEYLNLSNNPINRLPTGLGMPALENLIWQGKAEGSIVDGNILSDCPRITTLNLSNQQLADADFLRMLGNLRFLDLHNNQFKDITAITDLPNLTRLNIGKNRVSQLAPLATCSALATLVARHNPIEDPTSLSRLRSLESLDLERTGIRDLDFTKRLRNLYDLNVAGNEIGSMEALLELPNLSRINLRENRLAEVPGEILERRTLESLDLRGNPLEGLSPELYSGDGEKTLATLRDYYRGLARGRVKHDQVKLLLVGNGRVGKTSVVARLLDNEFDPDQPSTHGIQMRHWQLDDVAQDKLNGQPLKVDVWDFGGQDIYHATHRLFMKTRALFLLVWDRETESGQYSIDELGQKYENFRLPYWTDYIQALSGSPVIVVQNKVDELADKDSAYGQELQKQYPPPNGILDYRYVSAKRDSRNGIPGLRDSIAAVLENLESIGYELPAQWVEVRDRLLAMDHRYLDYDRYTELCTSVGMQPPEDLSLAGFLHQTGVVFYQPEDFGNRLILDQKWAIEAVYALFDRRGGAYADLRIAAMHGLTLDQMKRKVWQHFSVDEHLLLLEFMKSCEICFEFSEGTYYVPQLLPEEMPSRVRVRWPEPTEHCMQINYDFLHRAIIERFLVRTGLLGADADPEIWRNGIVIYDPPSRTEAMVEAVPADNRIRAYAKGEAPVRMLQMIRREFDDLHQDFPVKVAFSADSGRSFVDLEDLGQYTEAGAALVPTTDGAMTDLAPLKDHLDPREWRLPKGKLRAAGAYQEPAPVAKEIFVSYAWGDIAEQGESREAIVDRLYDAMTGKGFKLIRDKKHGEYRMLISEFMRRIGRGKLVVVVISDKYLKSPYCMFELLEIYQHGQFHERVFPIVLGDAKLYDLEDRLKYVAYWNRKKQVIEDLIVEIGLDAFTSDGAYQEYDYYYRRIFNNIDKLTALLTDWNAMTPELLEENNFEFLLEEVEKALH